MKGQFVITPHGPGEVVYAGEVLARVRIPNYLPPGVTDRENPERIYWFWRAEVEDFAVVQPRQS